MAQQSAHQLFLLADHLKLSLLERERAKSLNLEDPSKQDAHISRSLSQLQDGLEALEATQSSDADVRRLRQQYDQLSAQFSGNAATPASAALKTPNDASLKQDFASAQSRPTPQRSKSGNKSVRFRDDPPRTDDEYRDDPQETANRAALFQDQNRYRDEPAPPDHTEIDNQQIHAYHKQVLREQDDQLDVLGQSIGRQRVLGMEMGRELDEQVEMLDDVESGVDRHQSTLDRARRRLGNVARKSKDNWSWVTIGILICILVLLIIVLK